MKMPENAPQWLKDAKISADAEFTVTIRWGDVAVDWKTGVWIKGKFENGYFLGGEFRGG